MKAIFLIDGKKKCPKCGIEKEAADFHKSSKKTSGLSSQCKECRNKTVADWAARNPEKGKERAKKWRSLNKEKANVQGKAWVAANPEKRKVIALSNYTKHKDERAPAARIRAKEWYAENKEQALASSKNWAQKNREKMREFTSKYNRKFRSTPKGNLSSTMSKRMNESLRKGIKAGRHWESLVDFTIDQLKTHLEKLFTPEMNWDNYGSAWEIDHKIPISIHNFERPEDIDFKRCWNLKNLQPLGRLKNRSKSNKIDKPFQPALAIAV